MPRGIAHSDAGLVESETLEIVRGLLKELGSYRAAQNVSLNSSFERDLGLGSLERVELLIRLESRLKTRLPDEVAQQAETPAEWVQAILKGGEGRPHKPRYRIDQPSSEAPPAPEWAVTWIEVLRHHTELNPDRVHIHLLADVEEEGGLDLTYAQLFETASNTAAGLIAAGLRRDETVAIMLPTCADFFYAFFGIMMAGGIPVPIYPPARPDKIEEFCRRQVAILRNAQIRYLISFDRVKAVSNIIRLNIPSLVGVTNVDSLCQAGAGLAAASTEPSDTAFIQYTSGSTGDPKGVVLSQSNVLANVRGIGWAVKFRPDDIVVSWLPLYHDMGLIGSWLFSLYYGAPITVLSPLAFLSRPERWLWGLHNSRGTLCPAPNFSYELCTRKIPDQALEGLDLSRWRVAINAGEAVLPETLARFARRFQPYGFRIESFVPCYGLAESSVALTFPPLDRPPVVDTIRRDLFEKEGRAVPADPTKTSVLRFVACGKPMPAHEVKVVDIDGRELGDRVQGRLLFRGLSMTSEYYGNPAATAAVLTADGWMDSGDLAYWANGELYITGRTKDCIIKSGRNIIPQEVEEAAADVAGVRRGCVVAFGTADAQTGTERFVVVAETRTTASDEHARIEAEIVKKIDAVLGIPPDEVVLIPPQSIPKTSSGKIRRNETRSLYASGRLVARKRPPWLQMMRLWLANAGQWVGLGLRRAGAGLSRGLRSTVFREIAGMMGAFARLIPHKRAAARLIRSAARWILRLGGYEIKSERSDSIPRDAPVVLVANRTSDFDPLVLTATLRAPFLIADSGSLSTLPKEAAFLLRPLVLRPLNASAAPPGGTLRERVRRGLEEGHSVLVFPDGPVGAPTHLSRFRLDAFHAAVSSQTPIYPVGIRGTKGILSPDGRTGRRSKTHVVVGDHILPAPTGECEIVELRERVRKAIAKLCE